MRRKIIPGPEGEAKNARERERARALYAENIERERERGRKKSLALYHRKKHEPEWHEHLLEGARKRRQKPDAKEKAHDYYISKRVLKPPRPIPTDEELIAREIHKKQKAKEWYEDNKEDVKAKNRIYNKEFAEKFPEVITARRKTQYEKNREKAIRDAVEWVRTHPDMRRAITRRWDKANKPALRAKDARRRARELGAEGKFTATDIKWLMATQKGKCAECGISIINGHHNDHIIPITKGGSNRRQNIQLLCGPCNQSKGAMHPIDFARKKGRLL